MTVIVPLAIILFVPGVYCPPTEENVFPTRYLLQSCKSNSEHLRLDSPGSSFEIARSKRNPWKYFLIQTLSNRAQKYCFKKSNVEFVSMKDAEIMMITYTRTLNDQNNVLWNVTCVYPSITQARLFYNDMKHGLLPQMVLIQTAVSLERSGTVLENRLKLYVDCFMDYVTIVIKNYYGDPILIFPTHAVSQILRSDHTELSLYISIFDEQILYTIRFSCDMLTSLFSEILHRLCRHIDPTSAQGNRRWFDDPNYRLLFNRIEQEVEYRIRENQRGLPL